MLGPGAELDNTMQSLRTDKNGARRTQRDREERARRRSRPKILSASQPWEVVGGSGGYRSRADLRCSFAFYSSLFKGLPCTKPFLVFIHTDSHQNLGSDSDSYLTIRDGLRAADEGEGIWIQVFQLKAPSPYSTTRHSGSQCSPWRAPCHLSPPLLRGQIP